MERRIKVPYQFDPRDYQEDFLASEARFKIAVWNRRSGKSKTMLNQQVMRTQLKKIVAYYFLPTYRQAKQVMFDSLVKQHIPPEIVDKFNESELAVYYKNGSIQRFAGCEDIDKHRGIGPEDVVFDEYSEMVEEIWTAIIQPVLRENQGTATFGFTPKGKNHSWRLLQSARENPNWFVSVKNVHETKALTEEELAEAKREMPEALFNQEFMCTFQEGAGQVFRRIHENIHRDGLKIEEGKTFCIGVDLAKHRDWTVLTPFDYNTFHVGQQDRFNQVDWNLQEARIEAMHLRYNRARIRLDSTGVGDPIYENLNKKGLKPDPFVFTEESRTRLLENLLILLEKDKIKLPDDSGLIEELESFQYKYNEQNRKIKMISSGTDDRVMSLALAVWECPSYPLSYRKREERELLKNFDAFKKNQIVGGTKYQRQ